ncbi:MAG: PP0621 family protein [Burkholderiaceae bacterium]
MPRILFFVFLVFLVWLAVRWLGSLRKPGAHDTDASARAESPATQEIETMRQCAWCGAHVPAGDAVSLPDGRVYCGDAHREAARDTVAPSELRRRE